MIIYESLHVHLKEIEEAVSLWKEAIYKNDKDEIKASGNELCEIARMYITLIKSVVKIGENIKE